jgi:hypothetical protein
MQARSGTWTRPRATHLINDAAHWHVTGTAAVFCGLCVHKNKRGVSFVASHPCALAPRSFKHVMRFYMGSRAPRSTNMRAATSGGKAFVASFTDPHPPAPNTNANTLATLTWHWFPHGPVPSTPRMTLTVVPPAGCCILSLVAGHGLSFRRRVWVRPLGVTAR